ncbi:MAG: MOSC N-terminal beta barrel domain-containing protein [Acidimicrobiales bacterium]
MNAVGVVSGAWRYPVKSMQGMPVPSVRIGPSGIEGDRRRAVVDSGSGRVISAKRLAALLMARATDDTIILPDDTEVSVDAPNRDEVLSAWLGLDVSLHTAAGTDQLSYEMTFDPPDDSAELYEIPIPPGTFLDLSPVHLLTTATLEGCAAERPDLDWSLRRFRPNLFIAADGPVFVEDGWAGRHLEVGTAVLEVTQPTVRCAMPLRAQPAVGPAEPSLDRQPELYRALNDLHAAFPNHLGAYADVVHPGVAAVGDAVRLLDP